MGLLEKIGIKKKTASAQKPAKEPVAAPVSEVAPAESAPASRPSIAGSPKGDTGRAYQILLRPVLSEKGTHLAGAGKYVFAVHGKANKSEIKKSIQSVYNVQVRSVHIVKMPGKTRRYGRTAGRTAAWKKAIITVRRGEKIPGIIESVG